VLNNYNLTPRFDWMIDNFGGRDPDIDFASYSNIIFSNGELDPWTVFGLTYTNNFKITTIMIKEAAHGVDLNLPHEMDP
jgi:hypothetical protein